MSKLARLMAQREGDGIPGAIPTTHNNPGDLLHANGETHPANAPNSVGSFPTPEAGWNALEEQLDKFSARNLTLAQMATIYWPEPQNDTASCLKFICDGLGLPGAASVTEALEQP